MIAPIDIFSSEEMFRRRVQEILENMDVRNEVVNTQITTINTSISTPASHHSLTDLDLDDHTQYLLANGTRALTADWNMGTNKVGIGRVPTDDELEVQGDAAIVDNVNSHLAIECYSSTEADFPSARFKKSDSNTIRTMQQTNTLAVLGKLLFYGCNSSNAEAQGVTIEAKQNGAAGATYVPTDLTIETYSATAENTDQVVLKADGTTRIGTTSNYTEIEADGTLEFVGDATVWDDLRITPGSFDRPGSHDPSAVLYYPNGGSLGTLLYEFEVDDYACFTIQLPHNYKQGSDIYAHIHWTPGDRGNEENGKYVGWKIDYTWANIDGAFGDMQTLDLSDACDGTDHKHQMTPDVAITGTSKNISSMLLCNVRRSDTGTDDTWVGTISGQLPFILEIDFHYEIDTVGSRQRTAK